MLCFVFCFISCHIKKTKTVIKYIHVSRDVKRINNHKHTNTTQTTAAPQDTSAIIRLYRSIQKLNSKDLCNVLLKAVVNFPLPAGLCVSLLSSAGASLWSWGRLRLLADDRGRAGCGRAFRLSAARRGGGLPLLVTAILSHVIFDPLALVVRWRALLK